MHRQPLQFGLASIFGLMAAVALLAFAAIEYPPVGYPIIAGILFAATPLLAALLIVELIKAALCVTRNGKNMFGKKMNSSDR